MKLCMQVGLGPSHIVLDGDPAPPPQKGAEPSNFRKYPMWPHGWMDQDETLHAGRPRPWPHCVRWGVGTQLPSPKGGGGTAPIGPYLLWPSQWQDGSRCQLAREVGLSPSDTVLDRDPALPAKGEQHPPRLFSAHVYCGHGRQHL